MVSHIGAERIFSALTQQPAQMDALAQGALSSGIRYYQEAKYDISIREFQRVISLSPRSENALKAYDFMAAAYIQAGDHKGAIQAYQSALRLAPNQEDLHLKLGNIFLDEGKADQAVEAYKKAVHLNPNSTANLYSLGQAFLAKGSFDEAKTQFEKIVRLSPRSYGGYYGLGQAFYRTGQVEKAVEQFEKAIGLKEDFSYARLDLGYALADLGKAAEAYDQAAILKIKEPELAVTLGNYIYRVAKPQFLVAYSLDGFGTTLGPRTPVSNLDAALSGPGASREFTMKFIFSKEMDIASVENPYNWTIRRAPLGTPGGSYNWGLPVSETEIDIPPFPDRVRYDWDSNTAVVSFTLAQNAAANGTLDPSHLIFQFAGKDAYGNKMNPSGDQYGGLSKII